MAKNDIFAITLFLVEI